MRIPYVIVYLPDSHNQQRLCVLKRMGEFQQAASRCRKVTRGCNKWQLKALSLPHKPGWIFTCGCFIGGVTCANACIDRVLTIEHNTFGTRCCPLGMIRRVIFELLHTRDVTENCLNLCMKGIGHHIPCNVRFYVGSLFTS